MFCPAFHYTLPLFQLLKSMQPLFVLDKIPSYCAFLIVCIALLLRKFETATCKVTGEISQLYVSSYECNCVHIMQADYYIITEMFLFK